MRRAQAEVEENRQVEERLEVDDDPFFECQL